MQENRTKRQTFAETMPLALCAAALTFLSSCTGNPTNGTETPITKSAYEYFVELSKYPRCSGSEKPASDFLTSFGEAHGLYTYQDEAFNVFIKKNGSNGREKEPPIVLQAHIDMVCIQDNDADHDFENDPITPVINGDWITAQKRTTLGADNGSGVSMIMAVLDANCISHPPIEALFTTEEEFGLLGADKFDISLLGDRRLLNLDMVTEKVFVVASANTGGPESLVPIALTVTPMMKAALIPEWPYKPDAPLREKMTEVFRKYYGEEPLIAGLQHAAVECSIFASKMPDADMLSIGPDIFDIHTSNERMCLSSYDRVYGYLIRLLERL
jgi:di/tripeptidase